MIFKNIFHLCSVQTLLEIIDHLGSLIKNYLPTLIPSMIENAVEIEMGIKYAEQKLGIEVSENANDAIMSGHFSTEIIKKVCKRNSILAFCQKVIIE